mgnify:CR=1 FL=1
MEGGYIVKHTGEDGRLNELHKLINLHQHLHCDLKVGTVKGNIRQNRLGYETATHKM